VSVSEADEALEQFVNSEYTIDPRSFIQIKSEEFDFGDFPFALNEITINHATRNQMIKINASVNKSFLSSYWADGLIVATPTGSTAYSLSCGGPIVTPNSNNFILTPISAHNLTARPLVIGDTSTVKLRAECRSGQIQVTLDSTQYVVDGGAEITLSRAPFELQMILLEGRNFFRTIRKKMGWGLDIRID
jgi:NAD+ kinase